MAYTYPIAQPIVYTPYTKAYSTNSSIRAMQEKQAAAQAAAYTRLNQTGQNYYDQQVRSIDTQRQTAMGQVSAGGFALPPELQQYGSPQQINQYYTTQQAQKAKAEQQAKDAKEMAAYYQQRAFNSGVQLPGDVIATNDPRVYDAYISQAVRQRGQAELENSIRTKNASRVGAAGFDAPDAFLQTANPFQVQQYIAARQRYYAQLGQSAGYGANVPGFLSNQFVGNGAAVNYSTAMNPYSISQRENERKQQELDLQIRMEQLNAARRQGGSSGGSGGDGGASAERIRQINNHYAELGRLGSAEHLRDLAEAGAPISQYGYANR